MIDSELPPGFSTSAAQPLDAATGRVETHQAVGLTIPPHAPLQATEVIQ
jgi:hypothetical protein